MAGVGGGRRVRVPLALLVSRYFLYAIVGAAIAVGVPVGAFALALGSGAVLAADYGEAHLDEVAETLAGQSFFDPSAIPPAYRYARFGEDGALLDADMPAPALAIAGEIAGAAAGGENLTTIRRQGSFYAAVSLGGGGSCVLCYEVVPQWADKGLRDALPGPQDLLAWGALLCLIAVVALVALRAARVISREMRHLTRAAEAVGRQDLDGPVGESDVAEVDDVLRAMEEMRRSLKEAVEARAEAERRSREQVASLAHDLKTPLTVAAGNAELLAEDAAEGKLGDEQAACARAIHDAALAMDAFVDRIVEASMGREDGMHFEPVDPAVLAGRVEESAGSVAAARGLAFAASRTAGFERTCDTVAGGHAPQPRWDASSIERAVLNLVGNACDHGLGSHIALEFSGDGRELSIAVEDEGTGFSAEALERGPERFYRGDAARASGVGASHFGLGLAIASDVAAAHGGRLELSNRTDEEGRVLGARAAMRLPLPPS